MTDKAKAFTALGIFVCGMAAGSLLAHRLFVPPLERDIAKLEASSLDFQNRLIGQTASALAYNAEISNTSMQSREEAHALVQNAEVAAQVAVAVVKPESLDAVLPADFSTPIVGMYCQTARVVDCAGGYCRTSAATDLCAQADVGAQITLTTRQLGAALIRCARWTGEAGPDRYAIEQHEKAMKEAKGMGKSQ